MLKNCTILVALALAVAVAAKTIPKPDDKPEITYVGNNSFYIGNQNSGGFEWSVNNVYELSTVAHEVINTTLDIDIPKPYWLSWIYVRDRTPNPKLSAKATLVSGGRPWTRNAKLNFISQPGQAVNYTVYTYVQY